MEEITLTLKEINYLLVFSWISFLLISFFSGWIFKTRNTKWGRFTLILGLTATITLIVLYLIMTYPETILKWILDIKESIGL